MRRLSRKEWAGAGAMVLAVLVLHLVGWGVLFAFVAPRHFKVGSEVFGVGIGVAAYTLGMRHAFDADHIAAIDNTTRKLMADGKRPLSVGFWFSLGHSSVVFALTFVLGLGVHALARQVQNGQSGLHQTTQLFGTGISGVFLYLIAIINLVILAGIVKLFMAMRRGQYDEAALEEELAKRGLMNRFFGRMMRSISRPGQMYPVGVLFGLGFDTATEVALLVLAGSGVAGGLPWWAILCLPVLFAAGMSLLDTIDGSFMNFAYSWAFSNPVRKVYYNITITLLSVVVALLIGTVELLGLLGQELRLSGSFWSWVGGLNLNMLGYWIVGLFAVTWVLALLVWRLGGIGRRVTVPPAAEPVALTEAQPQLADGHRTRLAEPERLPAVHGL